MNIHWHWSRFEGLGLQDLYEALALRQRVFILEQEPYLDIDGLDQHSWHLLGRPIGGDFPGELLMYLRVVDPGRKFEQPSIGRVVVDPKLRGLGLGRVLMAEALKRCADVYPGQGNRISAQSHLIKFYGEFGYAPVGEAYLDDGVPHIDMVRQP